MKPGPGGGKNKWKVIRAICKSLLAGSTHMASCKAANISDGTLWRWRQQDPRLDRLLTKICDSRITHVEDALYASAIRGNIQNQQYFLNNRARSKWKKDPDVVVNNNNSNNAPTTFPDMKIIFVDSKEKLDG